MTQITLATLPQTTEQEVFDQVATHLLTQGVRSSFGGGCVYHGHNMKCAAGCLISENEYDENFEGHDWDHLTAEQKVPEAHCKLIATLQNLHDNPYTDPEDWLEQLACLAQQYGLNTNALQPWIQAS